MTASPLENRYDAIIVGARAAGAATAMLMARSGMKILCIDRQQYGSDTMSTHALMRGAVVQLSRWGLLDALKSSGAPEIRATEFHYPTDSFRVDIGAEYGVDHLLAPRRYVMDRLLVDAARDARATVVHGASFLDVQTGLDGRIIGAMIRHGQNTPQLVHAPLVIGADGRNSKVATAVAARTIRQGQHKTATIYGYFKDVENKGFQWYFGKDAAAGVIPTHDGEACVFASCRPARFRSDMKGGAGDLFHNILGEVSEDLGDQFRWAVPATALRGFPGQTGHLKQAGGQGWALVGDAGYFKDPATAHGLTDAFRDAELVASAAMSTTDIGGTSYQSVRDSLSQSLFDTTDAIASFDWDTEGLQALHYKLNKAMKMENAAMFDDVQDAA